MGNCFTVTLLEKRQSYLEKGGLLFGPMNKLGCLPSMVVVAQLLGRRSLHQIPRIHDSNPILSKNFFIKIIR